MKHLTDVNNRWLSKPRLWTSFALTLALPLLAPSPTLASSQAETEAKAAAETFPASLIELSNRPEFATNFFVVDKTRRFLRVYKNESGIPKLVMEVPSDLGKHSGPKLRENDHKTPVGIYFLQEKKSPPEIPFETYGQLAFTTDYPNIFDKREKRTGHGIWLHAVPDNVPLTRGSRGCVVVRNDMIKKLSPFVNLNQTPILIFEQLKELSKDEYLKQREQFGSFVETWRKAWQEEDIETYMKFYDPSFFNADMNYNQWYRHKKRLKGRYQFMRVTLSEPLILRNEDQVVIRVLQHYQSDKHNDFGEKTIHANYSPETGFKIVREDWKPIDRPQDWPTLPVSTQGLSSASANEPNRSPASTAPAN